MNEMATFLKRVIGVVIIGAIAYGAYAWYSGWWDAGASVSRVGEYVQNVTGIAKGKISDQAEQATNEAKEGAISYVSNVIGETIDNAASYLKNQTAKALSSVGETAVQQGAVLSPNASSSMPEPVGASFRTPPPPAAILISPGTPFVVTVNSDASYVIDWGDSLSDSGTSPKGESVLVSHVWTGDGDYTVKVSMKGSTGTQTQSFPVRVYR